MDYISQKNSSIESRAEQYKAEMKRLYAIAQMRGVTSDKEQNNNTEKDSMYNDFKVFDGVNIYEQNEISHEEIIDDGMYFDVEKYDITDRIAKPQANHNSQNTNKNTGFTAMTPTKQRTGIPAAQRYEEFKRMNPYIGRLKVQTYTARRAFPVAAAEIEISKVFDGEKYVILTTKTDATGMTEVIHLPAPKKQLIESSDETRGKDSALYHIKVKHPYFVTLNYYDVPIYQDVLSIQPCDFVPKVIAPSGQKEMNFHEQSID